MKQGFTTTEMVAALIAMSLVVVGLMAAARTYARALEHLTTIAGYRAAAPSFEAQLVAFLGDLERTDDDAAILKCSRAIIEGRCRAEGGDIHDCALSLQHAPAGWTLERIDANGSSSTVIKPRRARVLHFSCAMTGAENEASHVSAVFIERSGDRGAFVPWIAASP